MTDQNIELRIKSATEFDTRYLPVTTPQNILGLLDEDDNIDASWFPDWILGARRYIGTITAGTSLGDLLVTLSADLNDGEEPSGKYFVCTASVAEITTTATAGEEHHWDNGEEGDSSGAVTIESEDLVFLSRVVYDGGGSGINQYYWSIINNTYVSATTSVKGIVQLDTATDSTSTTKAATPSAVKSAYDLANSMDNYGSWAIGAPENSYQANITSGKNLKLVSAAGPLSIEGAADGSDIQLTFDIDYATQSVKGAVELATDTEVQAGTDTTRVVTPKQMFDFALPVFSSLANANTAAANYPTGKLVAVVV